MKTKVPLIERMQRGGAAKTWIKEVETKDRELERLEQTKDQYLNIINLLACEKEVLEAKLTAIECSDCHKTMLACVCDD